MVKKSKPAPGLTVEVCDKHIAKYYENNNLTAVDNWLDIRLEVMSGSTLLFAAPIVTDNTKAVLARGD